MIGLRNPGIKQSLAEPFEGLVRWIRAQFPQIEALRDGRPRVYLDNAAGTLVPSSVVAAMAEAAVWANAQPERGWPSAPETRAQHQRARFLVRAFLNADEGDPVYFSESTTAALYKLREGLEPSLAPGDNVVVTDCDHFANITPWEWRARWEVRRARMLPDGHLDLDHLTSLLDERTRVVALAVAGNGLGTILHLDAAIAGVRRRAPRAFVVLDGVHAAPHVPLDVKALGADALAFSTYKLFGPFCGVLWLGERLAAALDPYHVEPHRDVETLLEWGTLNNVTVAGVNAALDYVAALGERLEPSAVGEHAGYPRERRRFKLALAGIRDYEAGISRRLLAGMAAMPHVRSFGVQNPRRADERAPTFAFAVEGMDDAVVERRLWEIAGVQVAAGSHYSAAVSRGLGRAGVVRAGFAHYNSSRDVDVFQNALQALA